MLFVLKQWYFEDIDSNSINGLQKIEAYEGISLLTIQQLIMGMIILRLLAWDFPTENNMKQYLFAV